jgi:hypothetical protein
VSALTLSGNLFMLNSCVQHAFVLLYSVCSSLRTVTYSVFSIYECMCFALTSISVFGSYLQFSGNDLVVIGNLGLALSY